MQNAFVSTTVTNNHSFFRCNFDGQKVLMDKKQASFMFKPHYNANG